MEKRKVRIYKAGGNTGAYINKTATFLRKAMMGGVSDPNAYNNDIIKTAYSALKNKSSLKDVYDALLGQQMPEDQVKQILSQVYQLMIHNGEITPEDAQYELESLDEEEQAPTAQPQEFVTEQPQEKVAQEDPNAVKMDQYREQSMDIAQQPQEEEDYDTSYLGYEYGGESDDSDYPEQVMNQYDNQREEIEMPEYTGDLEQLMLDTPGMQNITFPGIEDYMYNYQPISDNDNIDYLKTIADIEDSEYRFGGSKKSYVKNVMSLLKKAEGGDETISISQATPMDNLEGNVKDKKSNFINSIKNTATEAKISEMYDQQTKPELGQAKRGGMITPREYKKLYKAFLKAQKAIGKGSYDSKVRMPYSGNAGFYNMYAGMPGMGGMSYPEIAAQFGNYNQPVHSKDLMHDMHIYDTDIFGRPKNYTIYNRPSSERQAKEAEIINNIKAAQLEMLPSDDEADEDNETIPMDYLNPAVESFPYTDQEAIDQGMGMQYGGALTEETPNLAKFMYGEATTPMMSKNINDPYDEDLDTDIPEARRGRIAKGLRNVLVPWNPISAYAGSWKQQQSLPFYAGTNNPYLGSLQGARPVATHVDKTTMLRRKPKEWTEYYQTPSSINSFDPGHLYKDANGQLKYYNKSQAAVNSMYDQDDNSEYNTDTSGMKGSTSRAVRRGEREMQRNERRIERNPEGNVPFIAGQSNNDNVGLGTKMKMFGAKLSGANQKREGGIPQYYPGGPTLAATKPAFNQFKAQCPPGYMIDPVTGVCKNFAGEIVLNNQTATAATTFGQNVDDVKNANPFAFSGQNNLTGESAMHFNSSGNAYANTGVEDLSQTEQNKPGNLIGAKFKNKQMKAVDLEAGVNAFNMGARGAINLASSLPKSQRNQEANMIGNATKSDSIYASQNDYHRGDWQDFGSMLGQYRFDQEGQDESGFSSFGKYGGQFAKGGEKVTYMSEKQIKDFIAAGGELEYL